MRLWGLDGQATSVPWIDDTPHLAVALSDDARLVASCTSTHLIRVIDTQTGKLVGEQRVEGRSGMELDHLFVSPAGPVVILRWRPPSGEPFADHLNIVTGARAWKPAPRAMSPDGDYLATTSFLIVHLLDLHDNARELARFQQFGPPVGITFSPDSAMLAAGFSDNNVYLYELGERTLAHTLEGHSGHVKTLSFSLDGARLATGSDDGTVKLWDPESGDLLSTLRGHGAEVDRVRFAPDGRSIVSVSSGDGTLKIWRTATVEEVGQNALDHVMMAREHKIHRRWIDELDELERAIAIEPRQPRLRLWRGARRESSLRAVGATADYQVVATVLPHAEEINRALKFIDLRPLAASVGDKELMWRYTTTRPQNDEDWKKTRFDDSGWQVGGGRFGNEDAEVRWTQPEIWLRHEFELEETVEDPLVFLAIIDDRADFYINGVHAGQGQGLSGGRYMDIQRLAGSDRARQALRPGKNVLAVHGVDRGVLSLLRVGLFTASETEALSEFLSTMIDSGANGPPLLQSRFQLHVARRQWKMAFADQEALRAIEEGTEWDTSRVREIVPPASSWRYSDTGSDLGTSWRDPDYGDSDWKEGPGPLGYGDPVATTVSFGANDQNKHPTTYFRRTFDVERSAEYSALRVFLRRDDAAAVYILRRVSPWMTGPAFGLSAIFAAVFSTSLRKSKPSPGTLPS